MNFIFKFIGYDIVEPFGLKDVINLDNITCISVYKNEITLTKQLPNDKEVNIDLKVNDFVQIEIHRKGVIEEE